VTTTWPLGAVDVGPGVDLGEGVAEGAEAVDEGAGRLGDGLAAVGLARLDRDQALNSSSRPKYSPSSRTAVTV
jgi:hypothetical protein